MNEKHSSNRVSVLEASKELGMDVATVRYLIETGQLPIGRYFRKKGAKRGAYVIWRDKLDVELGKRWAGDERAGER